MKIKIKISINKSHSFLPSFLNSIHLFVVHSSFHANHSFSKSLKLFSHSCLYQSNYQRSAIIIILIVTQVVTRFTYCIIQHTRPVLLLKLVQAGLCGNCRLVPLYYHAYILCNKQKLNYSKLSRWQQKEINTKLAKHFVESPFVNNACPYNKW